MPPQVLAPGDGVVAGAARARDHGPGVVAAGVRPLRGAGGGRGPPNVDELGAGVEPLRFGSGRALELVGVREGQAEDVSVGEVGLDPAQQSAQLGAGAARVLVKQALGELDQGGVVRGPLRAHGAQSASTART